MLFSSVWVSVGVPSCTRTTSSNFLLHARAASLGPRPSASLLPFFPFLHIPNRLPAAGHYLPYPSTSCLFGAIAGIRILTPSLFKLQHVTHLYLNQNSLQYVRILFSQGRFILFRNWTANGRLCWTLSVSTLSVYARPVVGIIFGGPLRMWSAFLTRADICNFYDVCHHFPSLFKN